MAEDHSELVKEHFDIKYYDYDVLIKKLIPTHEEMHQTVLDQIDFPSDKDIDILDLGVGTGQTAFHLLEKFPKAKIVGIDISSNMIEQAKIRLKDHLDRVDLIEQDIKDIDVKQEEYDACVAVLSVHHLTSEQKQELFSNVFKNLKKEGIFVIGDLIKFDSEEETKKKEEEWRQVLIKNFGEDEGKYWYENYKEEDLPDSIPDQLTWLKKAGFDDVGKVWEWINYAVFYGKK